MQSEHQTVPCYCTKIPVSQDHTPLSSPSGECNIHGGAGPFIAFYEVMGFHGKELICRLFHQETEHNNLAAAACSLYLQLSSVFQSPFPSLVV